MSAKNTIGVMAVAMLAFGGQSPGLAQGGQPAPVDSPHLVLLSAEVAEVVPPGRNLIRDRQVRFRLLAAGTPPCSAERSGVSYTFLIDSDRSTKTGVSMRGFPEIGIDQRLTIRCDPQQGRFVSASGAVDAGPAAGSGAVWELSVLVPLRTLPSTAFEWVALARDASRYDRIPRSGEVGRWAVLGSSW